MSEKILAEKNLIVRHRTIELVEHWAIAISGLLLLVTGIFELPVAKRYYIINVPGLGWSADFITSLYIHYAAALVFTVAGIFHLVYHGFRGEAGLMPQKGDMAASVVVIKSLFGFGEEPPMHKYLPEQRLAYAGMVIIMIVLVVSGLVKTYKNIYAPDMSLPVVLTATWAHNIAFILFFLAFLAHMGAIALRPTGRWCAGFSPAGSASIMRDTATACGSMKSKRQSLPCASSLPKKRRMLYSLPQYPKRQARIHGWRKVATPPPTKQKTS